MVRVITWYSSPIEKEKSSFSLFIHVQGKRENGMQFWRHNRSSWEEKKEGKEARKKGREGGKRGAGMRGKGEKGKGEEEGSREGKEGRRDNLRIERLCEFLYFRNVEHVALHHQLYCMQNL